MKTKFTKKSVFYSIVLLLMFGTSILSAKFWGSDCTQRWEQAGECVVLKEYCTDYVFWIPFKTTPKLLDIDC